MFPRAAVPGDLAEWGQKGSDGHHSLLSTLLVGRGAVGLHLSPALTLPNPTHSPFLSQVVPPDKHLITPKLAWPLPPKNPA